MKYRASHVGWFIALASLTWFGCSGSSDDDTSSPDDDGGTDAALDARIDRGPDAVARPNPGSDAQMTEPDSSMGQELDAGPDASVVEEASSPADEASADEPVAIAADAPLSEEPADASVIDMPDAGPTTTIEASAPEASAPDVSEGIADATAEPHDEPVVSPPDASADISHAEASVDAALDGDGSHVDAYADAGQDVPKIVDTGVDVPHEAALVDVTHDVVPEATFDVADEGPTAENETSFDAAPDSTGDQDSASPPLMHWTIEASPPECANPSVVACADNNIAYEFYAEAACPTAISVADLWFPGSTAPDPGQYQVLPAASMGDLASVGPSQVTMMFTRAAPAEIWWGQSGTVDVQIIGGQHFVQFSGVVAFEDTDHSRTTTIGGLIICQ